VISTKRIAGERAWALRARATDAAARADALTAIDDDLSWEWRDRLFSDAPGPVLASLEGLTGDRAWELRERFIERAPKIILRTIHGLVDERAWALRERMADKAKEVVDSIVGLDDERAWGLRARGAARWPATVVESLGPLSRGERGRAVMAELMKQHPDHCTLWRSVVAAG
jgi:hypothetical protein